ncbi:MAG: transglutaminase-like domain-containing protein [Burkholderiales bacterium]|nr:transglutaminase-like domain-containing protein [Burkholderiales bacterium]
MRAALRSAARAAARAAAIAFAAAAAGCASVLERIVDSQLETYFASAPAPAAPLQHPLPRLPFADYWTAIVFNGEKIGFAHFAVARAPEAADLWELRSEAAFALRFLGVAKKVNLRARDLVTEDLGLQRFEYRYVLDESEMTVEGRREGDELVVRVTVGGTPHEQRHAVSGPLYPSSAILLYPVLHGLAPGREYAFRVFSGELQAVRDVAQRVEAYQTSRLFRGGAYKVETRLAGQRVLTWIDERGRPVFELGMQGVMISALEDEHKAKRELALAALNKKESLLDYSLVRPDRQIARARAVATLRIALSGAAREPPSDGWQRCAPEGTEIVCEIGPVPSEARAEPRHLAPSLTVQSADPEIRRLAAEIVGEAAGEAERLARIVRWMDAHIEKAPFDVFSARDVLERRRAECQGHAWLFAALARAAGIPTRVVNGLAYSEDFGGFLFHAWNESLVDGAWRAVDATFGQVHADATHLKLFEGETLAELAPLLDFVGRLRIRVLGFEHSRR